MLVFDYEQTYRFIEKKRKRIYDLHRPRFDVLIVKNRLSILQPNSLRKSNVISLKAKWTPPMQSPLNLAMLVLFALKIVPSLVTM
jgi:hypothetical protein